MFNFGNENVTRLINFVVRGTDAATAANFTSFFVADRPYKLVSATEIHTTAGTNGSAVTMEIERCTGTTAAGSGTVISGSFDMKGTALTTQYKEPKSDCAIGKGDRLALKLTGTPTALANVVVNVVLKAI